MIRQATTISLAFFAATIWAQQPAVRVSGTVKDTQGRPLAGVTINDGYAFTQTDDNGQWTLLTDTTVSKFITISVPAICKLPQNEGIAEGFYVGAATAVRKGGHDFVFERRTSPADKFCYIAISDPQVKTQKDLDRWRNETIVDLKALIDSVGREREVVGNTLGDLVFDMMDLYGDYRQSLTNTGMTTFQCIGNHDFDQRYQDLHNTARGAEHYGEEAYNATFGPTDYSYNIGKIHVVTIKNINYTGRRTYIESITGDQIQWLKNDLSYVPKGTTVILNMHAAGWNTTSGGDVRNAADLVDALRGYNAHVFCGHTHMMENVVVNDSLYEHNIGAACGAWWKGWINRCGAPNGYMVVDVDGSDLKWHYKSTCRPFDYQFSVYKPGTFTSQDEFVVANVWDWDKDCTVEWTQDGKHMGSMERFTGADEGYASSLSDRSKAIKTPHLFRAAPSDDAAIVEIIFTNRFGETYSQTVTL